MPTPNSYLERYLAGERVAVWGELIALGEAVRTPPLLDEALAVSREIVRRAKYNLGLLHQRLLDLGYEFANPAEAFRLAGPEDIEQIDKVDRHLGTLSLFARVWYESIASVRFTQADTQRFGPTDSELGGLGHYTDLVVLSLRASQKWKVEMIAEGAKRRGYMKVTNPELWQLNYQRDPHDPQPRYQFLPTGGVASNCDPKAFSLPCVGIDGVIYNEGDGDVYLVQELRHCFQCGGFPMWGAWPMDTPEPKPQPWDTRPKPNWRRIMPLLKEGLLEI